MSSKFDEILSKAARFSSNVPTALEDFDTSSQTNSGINEVYDFITNNLVDLPIKTEEAVVAFIKSRFISKEFYTWAGQTLLAVHSYEKLEIKPQEEAIDTPSVTSLIDKAWFRLIKNLGKINQTIVISGVSGSGKTYSACLAIKHITTKSCNKQKEKLLWQIWSSIPLLIAFGNATTIHNSSSSRFGKLLQLQCDESYNVVGAFISTYLLEKSRVSGPNMCEGNFHIFQLLLENIDENLASSIYLDLHTNYKIVPSSTTSPVNYEEVIGALNFLDIKQHEDIFKLLSIILNLGNVDFELTDSNCFIKSETIKFVENAAKLLNAETKIIVNFLITRIITPRSGEKQRRSLYTTPCHTKQECEARRNCLMKYLYEHLFHWLVEQINEHINANGNNFRLFGILDIYGFETFNQNGFEQLCINYANEKLQHYFVNDYLIGRQSLYEDCVYVEILENNEYATRMLLLDGPAPSVFSILNEECMLKRYNNDVFVNNRLAENLKRYPHFMQAGNNYSTQFCIKHFAGTVEYSSSGMVAKNRDKMPVEMLKFLSHCEFNFVRDIVSIDYVKEKTMLSKFKKSLDNLISTLNTSDVHYIKCLKPNLNDTSQNFDEVSFAKQLKNNGIFDILKLAYQNYSIQLTIDDFNQLFSSEILELLKNPLKLEMHIGRQFIYLTERSFYKFQVIHNIRTIRAAKIIQKYWRKFLSRRYGAVIAIQRFYRKFCRIRSVSSTEKIIDVSRKDSTITMNSNCEVNSLNDLTRVTSHMKTLEYIESLQDVPYLEGDPISLTLEKIYNQLEPKPFTRNFFHGDHVVSYLRIPEIPIRIHLSKTCIPFSHLPPISEVPQGLYDIL